MAQTATSAENIPVSATSILALPDMVLIGIVQFLGPRDIVAFGSVCKRFMGPAAEDRLVWGPICQAIVGSAAAASPDAWHAPSFQRLYCRLLRTYGELLAGPWRGRADPLGSLLVAFPSPPYIIGGVITSLKLAEPGVTVVPVFRVSYDSVSGDASVSCLRGRNMFESLLRRLATQETQSHSGHTPSLEEEDPFGAEGVHTAELQFHFEQDAPSAAASVDGAGGSAESGPVPAQVQPPLATTEGGASDAEEGAGASTSTAATAADGNGQTGAAAAAVALQHMDRTSDDAFSASARRPHPDCLGTLGFEPRNFAFRCSGCCRQQELEAVCRWAPAGTFTQLLEATARSGGAMAITSESSGVAGSSSEGGGRRSSASIGTGGDLLVDLDVLALHSFHERVQRVVVTLYGLMNQNWNGSVSYSRLRLPEQGSRMDLVLDDVQSVSGGDERINVASRLSARISEGVVGNTSQDVPRLHDIAAATSCCSDARELLTAPGGTEAAEGTRVSRPLVAVIHPLVGIWRGTYGAHGIEHILLKHVGPQLLEARKLTGDSNIPAGETSFRIFLDKPGPYAAQRGRPFRLPPDYVSRADVTFPSGRTDEPGHNVPCSGAAQRMEVLVLDGFEAQGQVAGIMYNNPQWISAEAVVLGHNTFGVLWYDLQSFSTFRRVQLHAGYPR